jgi:hypothetical protein
MLQNYQKYYATILCYNIMPQYYATILCCNTMLQHRCSALFPCYETQRLMHSHLHAWNELYMLIHSHANEPCHVVIRFFDDLSDFMITHFATNCLLFLRIPVHKLHLIGRYILTHTHTHVHTLSCANPRTHKYTRTLPKAPPSFASTMPIRNKTVRVPLLSASCDKRHVRLEITYNVVVIRHKYVLD